MAAMGYDFKQCTNSVCGHLKSLYLEREYKREKYKKRERVQKREDPARRQLNGDYGC
jgi:hypothetical protein